METNLHKIKNCECDKGHNYPGLHFLLTFFQPVLIFHLFAIPDPVCPESFYPEGCSLRFYGGWFEWLFSFWAKDYAIV